MIVNTNHLKEEMTSLKRFWIFCRGWYLLFFSTMQQTILDDVKGGVTFSKALAKNQALFGDFYINMIRSGEASGQIGVLILHVMEASPAAVAGLLTGDVVTKFNGQAVSSSAVRTTGASIILPKLTFDATAPSSKAPSSHVCG